MQRINPDIFLRQEDIPLLVWALNRFALEINTAASRRDILVNAGIHVSFLNKLMFEANPILFANQLTAHFRAYHVSSQNPRYHPMIKLLEYLLQVYSLEDQERIFFQKLVKQGLDNFAILTASLSVGRIEAPSGEAYGSGVLLDKHLVLTCDHILKRILEVGQERGWVRFSYKYGEHGIESGEFFEIDIKHPLSSSNELDYALVQIRGEPEYPSAPLHPKIPIELDNIHLIHHPQGKPQHISEAGQILQINQESLTHTIKVDYGSSGGPIFNQDWHLIAMQRRIVSIGHAPSPDRNEAVSLYTIWPNIKPHLPLFKS